MSILIPQGFFRVACSELLSATAEVYWNATRRMLLVKVTTQDEERLVGPFAQHELEAIPHAINDVKDMKGNYGAC